MIYINLNIKQSEFIKLGITFRDRINTVHCAAKLRQLLKDGIDFLLLLHRGAETSIVWHFISSKLQSIQPRVIFRVHCQRNKLSFLAVLIHFQKHLGQLFTTKEGSNHNKSNITIGNFVEHERDKVLIFHDQLISFGVAHDGGNLVSINTCNIRLTNQFPCIILL